MYNNVVYMIGAREKRKLKVGVMRGGPSDEYEVSLKTGKNVIDSLQESGTHDVQDIFIDRSGSWHIDGVIRPVERIFPHIDVAVNAMHGSYGEDGRVQQLLESHHVPFTGSGSLGSAISMNKALSKKFFKENGLLTPEHVLIKKSNFASELFHKIFNSYPHLKLVKPVSSGSSLGVTVFKTASEFEDAVNAAFNYSDSVLVEEYIKGREATCGVLEDSDGNIVALHPVEIRDLSKSNKDIWGYNSKYSNDLHELICPGNFTEEETQRMMQSAVTAHKALGLRHYSRSDFIVTRRGIYILETNTLPGLTSTSLYPKALSVAGISIGEFLNHIIELALRR